MGLPASLRTKAAAVVRRKLDGDQCERALAFVRADTTTHLQLDLLLRRLYALPDLDSPARRTQRSEAMRAQAVADYRAGRGSLTQIAARYGVARPTLSLWIRNADRGTGGGWIHHDPHVRAEAAARHAAGELQRDLAVEYGVTKGTMSVWCNPTPTEGQEYDPAMATRQEEMRELVRRCERVGWETEYSGDGVKVKNPEGKIVAVHLTSSDYRGVKNKEAALNRLGLKEAEEAMERARKTTSAAKMRVERDKADEKATLLAARNGKSVLQRAAGPYLVDIEEPGLDWFTSPHPSPWMRWVYLTPTLAGHLLKDHNQPGRPGLPGTNRPQSETRIAYYRDIIVSGQWHLTHQGIAMDQRTPKPMVQDGQHRLAGIVAAGRLLERLQDMSVEEREYALGPEKGRDKRFGGILTDDGDVVDVLRVPVAFFVGMPVENFNAIDDVLLRTAAQLFTQAGEKHGSTVQAASRLVVAYRSGDARLRNRKRMSNIEVMDVLDGDSGDAMRAAAALANNRKTAMSNGAFAAGYYLIGQANGADNGYVKAFFDGVLNGFKVDEAGTRIMLDDDDPRQALRVTMQEKKDRGDLPLPLDQVGMIITAWNMLVTGRHKRRITWYKGTSEIPEILVCHDTGPHASATPRALAGEVVGG